MKTKSVVLLLLVMLFNSCIVKSLHPFYTKSTISFTNNLLGVWKDQHDGVWNVRSCEALFLEELAEKEGGDLKKDELDQRFYEGYKNKYYIKHKTGKRTEHFIATSFKINGQFFLDFYPMENENIEGLIGYHYVGVHSLVKLVFMPDGKLEIKWFDSDEMNRMFEENRIKIKHEKIGLVEDGAFVLTASSNEIQKFLKKYLSTKHAEKWETSTKFSLTKS